MTIKGFRNSVTVVIDKVARDNGEETRSGRNYSCHTAGDVRMHGIDPLSITYRHTRECSNRSARGLSERNSTNAGRVRRGG